MEPKSDADNADFLETPYIVESDAVEYTDESITSFFEYDTVLVSEGKARPKKTPMIIRTKREVRKLTRNLLKYD